MGVIGDMGKFQQYSLGEAMRESATHGGGGEGLGMGLGLAMAGRMMTSPAVGFGGPAVGGPPAPPMPPVWHVAVNGQTQGPFSPEQIQQGIQAGQIAGKTLLWSPQLTGWTAAEQIPNWSPLFQRIVPPPPPPPV